MLDIGPAGGERRARWGIWPRGRAVHAFRAVLARPPKPAELSLLLNIYYAQVGAFRSDPGAAQKLLAVGESKRDQALDPAELAAWTSVASVLFNLDEAITKN